MTTTDDPRPEESAPNDERYAGVPTSDGYLLYDTEADSESAWIKTDTALDLDEVL